MSWDAYGALHSLLTTQRAKQNLRTGFLYTHCSLHKTYAVYKQITYFLAFFSTPLMAITFSWWARFYRNKTPATKNRTHECIIKLTPQTMNSVCWSRKQGTNTAWTMNIMAIDINFRFLGTPKKWDSDWFWTWSRWICDYRDAWFFMMWSMGQ